MAKTNVKNSPSVLMVAAMQQELDPLFEQVRIVSTIDFFAAHSISVCQPPQWYSDETVTLLAAVVGIGKVSSACSLTQYLEVLRPTRVISIGTAGKLPSVSAEAQLLVGDAFWQHDVDLTAFGYARGELPAHPAKLPADPIMLTRLKTLAYSSGKDTAFGTLASGDQFLSSTAKTALLQAQDPDLIGIDMESSALAQVCARYKTPFISIRAVSDQASDDAAASFKHSLATAARRSSKLALELVQAL